MNWTRLRVAVNILHGAGTGAAVEQWLYQNGTGALRRARATGFGAGRPGAEGAYLAIDRTLLGVACLVLKEHATG